MVRLSAGHGERYLRRMTFIVKTVKGRQYLYDQRSYRVGKRVRTISRYIGPLSGGGSKRSTRRSVRSSTGFAFGYEAQQPGKKPVMDESAFLPAIRAEEARDAERDRQLIENFERETGLKMGPAKPVPIERPMSSVSHLMNSPNSAPVTTEASQASQATVSDTSSGTNSS